MSALLISLFTKAFPYIVGVGIAAGGLFAAWAKGKKADTKVAQAQASEADAHARASAAEAQASATNEAAAQANAAAAQAAAQKAQEAQNVDQTVAGMSGDDARKLLESAGLVRNEDGSAGSLSATPQAAGSDGNPNH